VGFRIVNKGLADTLEIKKIYYKIKHKLYESSNELIFPQMVDTKKSIKLLNRRCLWKLKAEGGTVKDFSKTY
jgi:hypothetical protein